MCSHPVCRAAYKSVLASLRLNSLTGRCDRTSCSWWWVASEARSGHDGNCLEARSPNVVAPPEEEPENAPLGRARDTGVLERALGPLAHGSAALPRRAAGVADAYAEAPAWWVVCSWRRSACEIPEGLPAVMLELRWVREVLETACEEARDETAGMENAPAGT